MIIPLGLLSLLITCAKTTNFVYNGLDSTDLDAKLINSPRLYNVVHYSKREVNLPTKNISNNETKILLGNLDTNVPQEGQSSNGTKKEITAKNKEEPVNIGLSEGGNVGSNAIPETVPAIRTTQKDPLDTSIGTNLKSNETKAVTKANVTISTPMAPNVTVSDKASETNSPGVVKRAVIVFGGFSLLAIAYFIFYRKKNKKYDSNNTHNANDSNQFRYGVLQSDDRRDNLELSRIPLTMESDEDEDEDLEIFDLEQKKKSLSYVNLQTHDEDVVLHSSKDESKNNLLLDIEDGPSDTLINWSNNGNKSIL